MWSDGRIPNKEPQLQCTAEHLIPKSEGGGDDQNNIVAACLYCNRIRHRGSKLKSPEVFRVFVKQRLRVGRWYRAQH
ncbi:HNH endonuclease signature motif containing protein [Mesorhizobium sp. L-8-3]|uniref:HNH endonuclease signature motif containing protein n=1 Tax=Mesorhizobium sp. L-8-3 TaxID=2744522 RepID=UPI00406C80E8